MKKLAVYLFLVAISSGHKSLAKKTILVPRPDSYSDSSYVYSCLVQNHTAKKLSMAFKDDAGSFCSADPEYIEPFGDIEIQFPRSLEFFIWTGTFIGQFRDSGLINSTAEFKVVQIGNEISIVRLS